MNSVSYIDHNRQDWTLFVSQCFPLLPDGTVLLQGNKLTIYLFILFYLFAVSVSLE